MIYLTSDLHFNHDKEFVWKARGFNSVEEMNEEIIKRFNSRVQKDDTVYILGDICMSGNLEKNKELIERLNGNLYIILGNHDTNNRITMYFECKNVKTIIGYADVLNYRKYRFYLSHYPTNTANYDCEEPLRARTINLCGHIHTKDKLCDIKEEGSLRYHVEVDAHNCYPVLIDDIITELKLIEAAGLS